MGGAHVSASESSPDLRVQLGALKLQNPILTASGTFGYGLEFDHLTRLDRLGGLVTKGLSLEPIAGNPAPRICETRGGMLNSIGLQNIGIERYLSDVLPGLRGLPTQIIVNLFGYTQQEYRRLAERVDSVPQVAAVELNVSCPNVKRGGIEFGHDPDMLELLVRSVRCLDQTVHSFERHRPDIEVVEVRRRELQHTWSKRVAPRDRVGGDQVVFAQRRNNAMHDRFRYLQFFRDVGDAQGALASGEQEQHFGRSFDRGDASAARR